MLSIVDARNITIQLIYIQRIKRAVLHVDIHSEESEKVLQIKTKDLVHREENATAIKCSWVYVRCKGAKA